MLRNDMLFNQLLVLYEVRDFVQYIKPLRAHLR